MDTSGKRGKIVKQEVKSTYKQDCPQKVEATKRLDVSVANKERRNRRRPASKKRTLEEVSKECSKETEEPSSGFDGSKKKKKVKSRFKKNTKLPPGVIFTSFKGNEFRIIEMIGAGGFGEVHKVIEANSNALYALKTEFNREGGKDSRLKMEVLVFKSIDKQFEKNSDKCKHFIKMFDCGMTDMLKFLVMSLTGQNLEDIRTYLLLKDFSFANALNLCCQTFESISDFHELGYVHRDIKPSNFCVGSGSKRRIIFIIDFGMAQRYEKRERTANGNKFEGTIRYASRNCHNGLVQWPKDDYESWLYASVEFFQKQSIPWRRASDKSEVLMMKRNYFKHQYNQCYVVCPKDFAQIARHVDEMPESFESVDVVYISNLLEKLRKKHNVKKDDRYEWEEIENETSKMPSSSAHDDEGDAKKNRTAETPQTTDGEKSERRKKQLTSDASDPDKKKEPPPKKNPPQKVRHAASPDSRNKTKIPDPEELLLDECGNKKTIANPVKGIAEKTIVGTIRKDPLDDSRKRKKP